MEDQELSRSSGSGSRSSRSSSRSQTDSEDTRSIEDPRAGSASVLSYSTTYSSMKNIGQQQAFLKKLWALGQGTLISRSEINDEDRSFDAAVAPGVARDREAAEERLIEFQEVMQEQMSSLRTVDDLVRAPAHKFDLEDLTDVSASSSGSEEENISRHGMHVYEDMRQLCFSDGHLSRWRTDECRMGYRETSKRIGDDKASFDGRIEKRIVDHLEMTIELMRVPKGISRVAVRVQACAGGSESVDDFVDRMHAQNLPYVYEKPEIKPTEKLGKLLIAQKDGRVNALKKSSMLISVGGVREKRITPCIVRMSFFNGSGLFGLVGGKQIGQSIDIDMDRLALAALAREKFFDNYQPGDMYAPLAGSFDVEIEGLLMFVGYRFTGMKLVPLIDHLLPFFVTHSLHLSYRDERVLFDANGVVMKRTALPNSGSSSYLLSQMSNVALFDILNNEAKAMIFAQLDSLSDLFNVCLVCKSWYNLYRKYELLILSGGEGFQKVLRHLGQTVHVSNVQTFMDGSRLLPCSKVKAFTLSAISAQQFGMFFQRSFLPTEVRFKIWSSKTDVPDPSFAVECLAMDLVHDYRFDTPNIMSDIPFAAQRLSPKHTSLTQMSQIRNGVWSSVNAMNLGFKTMGVLFRIRGNQGLDVTSISDFQIKGISAEMLLLVPFHKFLLSDARNNLRRRMWREFMRSYLVAPRLVFFQLQLSDLSSFLRAIRTDGGVDRDFRNLLLRGFFLAALCQIPKTAKELNRDEWVPWFDEVRASVIQGLIEPQHLRVLMLLVAVLNFGEELHEPTAIASLNLYREVANYDHVTFGANLEKESLVPLCLAPFARLKGAFSPISAPFLDLVGVGLLHNFSWAKPAKLVAINVCLSAISNDLFPVSSEHFALCMEGITAKQVRDFLLSEPRAKIRRWILTEKESCPKKDIKHKMDRALEIFTDKQAIFLTGSLEDDLQVALSEGICTYTVTNMTFVTQKWFGCRTCWPGENNMGCCVACLEKCHANHDVYEKPECTNFCDCSSIDPPICKCYSPSQVQLPLQVQLVGNWKIDIPQVIRAGICTYTVTKSNYGKQTWFSCNTCWPNENLGCCISCSTNCHDGHELVRHDMTFEDDGSGFFCDCPLAENVTCNCNQQERVISEQVPEIHRRVVQRRINLRRSV